MLWSWRFWRRHGTIADMLSDLLARQPAPPYALVIATAVAALVVVVWRPVWRLARNAITIAHEGGHALVAVLCGRQLQSIRLHSDTSGLTVTRGKRSGLGMVLTLLVGYVAPSILGVAGAVALASGHIRLTLWIAIALLFLMFTMIRNFYGVLTILLAGGAVFAVSWYASVRVQALFAYAGVWFLLVGGVRPTFELARQRRRGRARDSDVDQLATITGLPGALWLGLQMIVAIVAVAWAAHLLGLTARFDRSWA
jgi:hypothetical protein